MQTQKLISQLQELRGGSSLYHGQLGDTPIELEVEGLGPLVFPLNAIQAEALIERAEQAPFGKGMDTIVDTEVRRTHQISAEQFHFTDDNFHERLSEFLGEAAREMFLPDGIEAVPYKLLIYQPGDFFVAHQDSEKLPGMFGTLLVGLPSPHEGGQISIDPGEGDKVTVDFSKNGALDLPALAFIADRKHEILPVTAGYRVVLVYNLVLPDGEAPELVDIEQSALQLKESLETMSINAEPLILTLDHQYTDTNFSTNHLKGNDVVRVAALRRAAELAGLEIRVGLINDTASAEWENAGAFGQAYQSRSSYYYEEAYLSAEPTSFEEVEIGYPIDDSLSMDDWLPEDGPSLGSLWIGDADITKGPGYQEDEPIQWSVEGYQGNWGMTADYTYRYAGVMLWYPAATGKVLAKLPLEGQIAWAGDYARQLTESPDSEALARRLSNLEKTIHGKLVERTPSHVDADTLIDVLATQLKTGGGEATFYFDRWAQVLALLYRHISNLSWELLIDVFGSRRAESLLTEIASKRETHRYGSGQAKITVLLSVFHYLASHEKRECQEVGDNQMALLPTYLAIQYPGGNFTDEVLEKVLKITARFPQSDPVIGEISAQLLKLSVQPEYLHQVLGKNLLEAKGSSSLYRYLHQAVLKLLRERVARPPEPYPDWSRPLPPGLSPDNSPHGELLEFMLSPTEEVYRYQRPQRERSNLERLVEFQNLDLRASTLRTRPAHTLVLTKTDASYHRAVRQYAKDEKLLKKLSAPDVDASPGPENAQTEFILSLCEKAVSEENFNEEQVRRALALYRDYFADLAAGRKPQPQKISPAVDNLLTAWEIALNERLASGIDEPAIPAQYANLDDLSRAAFAEVLLRF